MVIVISDRKVIDKQLQRQVQAIEKVKGIVEVIDEKKTSQDLKEALKTDLAETYDKTIKDYLKFKKLT